jgi:hypothetical protein
MSTHIVSGGALSQQREGSRRSYVVTRSTTTGRPSLRAHAISPEDAVVPRAKNRHEGMMTDEEPIETRSAERDTIALQVAQPALSAMR